MEQIGMTLEDKIAKKGFDLVRNESGTFTARKKWLSFTRDTIEELFQVVKPYSK